MSDLPTKPGAYYWRESDGDKWEHIIVIDPGNGHLYGRHSLRPYGVETPLHDWEKDYGDVGQWLQIPTAEELVELQSAKKMVDESREQWQIWNPCHSKLEMVGRTEDEAITAFRKSIKSNNPPEPWSQFLAAGYTCRKVRVCQEVES